MKFILQSLTTLSSNGTRHAFGQNHLLVRASRRVLSTCIFLTVSGSRLALALDAEALFQKGLDEMELGHFDKACPAIQESLRLDPRPGTLFTLAECEAMAGNIATSVARYGEYLDQFNRMKPDQQAKQKEREKTAAKQKQLLTPEIPQLTLILPTNAPKGTRVFRDGVELDQPALGVPLPVDPGEHVIAVEAPGQSATTYRVQLKRRESKVLELEIKAQQQPSPPPPPPPPPPPRVESRVPPVVVPIAPDTSSGTSGRRITAYALGGTGLVGIIVGAVTGGLVFDRKTTIQNNCTGLACNPNGLAAVNEAETLSIASNVSFAIGGVALATGVVFFLTEPRSKASMMNGVHSRNVGVVANSQGFFACTRGEW